MTRRVAAVAGLQWTDTHRRGVGMANQILPVVKLFVVCEEVSFDTESAGYVLRIPLHNVALPGDTTFPFEWDRLDCYAQLSDAVGTFRFAVEVLPEAADTVLYRSSPVELMFPVRGRIMVFEQHFRLTDVRFPRPEVYRVRLVCNHAPLPNAEATIRILGGFHP